MLQIKKIALYKSVFKPEDIPNTPYNEVAFVGRSNVGKSTLLNVIAKNYKIAKVSSEPGKTRSINFYLVNDKFFIVDLPGYGFAKVPKRELERWRKLIERYLKSRDRLKGIFLLVDSRVGPTEKDLTMKNWLEFYGIPFVVVATKVDKLKMKERANLEKRIKGKFGEVEIIPFSSVTREGRVEVLKAMERLLNA